MTTLKNRNALSVEELTSVHKTLSLLVKPLLIKGSDIIFVLSPGVMSLPYRGLKINCFSLTLILLLYIYLKKNERSFSFSLLRNVISFDLTLSLAYLMVEGYSQR